MVANKKITGRATSLPAGLAIGAVCSLAATLILTAILAKLVEAETLPVEKVGYGIMVLRWAVQRRRDDRAAGSGGQRSRRTAGTAAGQGSKTDKNQGAPSLICTNGNGG